MSLGQKALDDEDKVGVLDGIQALLLSDALIIQSLHIIVIIDIPFRIRLGKGSSHWGRCKG